MSVREHTPWFQWGFSLRRSKFLVPLLSNNVFISGAEAVSSTVPSFASDVPLIRPVSEALRRDPEVRNAHDKDWFVNDERTRAVSTTTSDAEQQVEANNSTVTHTNNNNNNNNDDEDDDDDIAALLADARALNTNVRSRPSAPTTTHDSDATPPQPSCTYAAVDAATKPSKPTAVATKKPQAVDYPSLSDAELVRLVLDAKLPAYALEARLGDPSRAVRVRRQVIAEQMALDDGSERHATRALAPRSLRLVADGADEQEETSVAERALPHNAYDYKPVIGACCENVVGYVPVPVGVVGPLCVDGRRLWVPFATTEGCLVASTCRGCKAIAQSGGCHTEVLRNGMSRAPVLRFPNIQVAAELRRWVEEPATREYLAAAFNGTSRFARLKSVRAQLAGRLVYLRIESSTGDAMGMNMVSKGTEALLDALLEEFPECEVLSLSGNFCTDKKAAAVNWLDGRGKSVVCEVVLRGEVVRNVLKTNVEGMVELNVSKNLVGSALAGTIGGFNAHAANIVTGIFLATGQDVAQNVESSNCITLMEPANGGKDLRVSVTMPSIEVGTVGGGTALPAQAACLDMLGIRGANRSTPGANAELLARVVCASVLAGEISLMGALAAGHLMKSHLRLNRSSAAAPTPASTTTTSS